MRRSPISLYTPLLIVVLVQALIIAVAPSRTAQPSIGDGGFVAAPGATGTTGTDATGGAATTGAPSTSGSTDGGTAGGADVASPGGTSGGSTSGGSTAGGSTTTTGGSDTSTGGTTGTTSGGTTTGGTGSTRQPTGDTSHCTDDGRQHDVIYHAPVCAPKWEGGDNGGATWRGVTEDTITVLLFRENRNPQVTALLNAYNLRATKEQDREMMDAAEDFVNTHYEFYGRQVDFVLFDAANCPETPPDVPACRAEARRAIAEHDPFAVIWPQIVYSDVFDEFTKEGVISLGGWHHANSYFAGRRPYRYDVFMDGTRSADVIVEYVCKKLVGGKATHAGQFIHPSYPAGGPRDQMDRVFGVTVAEPPAERVNGERAVAGIRGCGGQAQLYTFEADINRAQEQSAATTAAMVQDGVTSVICLCNPITPVFRTESASRNNWYPEWIMPGMGLLDYDLLGRLYDKRQWAHAFGPSHLGLYRHRSESDSSRVWRAGGREGNACASCDLNTSYFTMIAAMIQNAGPNLNPSTVEQGTLNDPPRGGWAATGGDPTVVLSAFGREDYTLLSDFKEVYWREEAISRIDGNPGAYVAMYEGQRWRLGDLPSVFEVPQPAS